MKKNNDSRVLLISPNCFGYENTICEELKLEGYCVTFISESIDMISPAYHFMAKLFPNIIFTKMIHRRYYKKRVTPNNDYVIVIRGGLIPVEVINFIHEKNPNAKFILYQWDSLEYNPRSRKLIPLFDQIITMDMCDAKEYGWKYVPLFYACQSKDYNERFYDIAFIGSMQTKRARIVKKIKQIQKSKPDIRIFTYLYMPFLSYIKQKYIIKNKDYVDLKIKDIKFRSLPIKKTYDIYSNTRIMADYTIPGQNGYNIRIIESLACRYKVVTNNRYVKEADFYDSNNIWVYEDDRFEIPENFLKNEYKELANDIYQKYSINEWIRRVLEI